MFPNVRILKVIFYACRETNLKCRQCIPETAEMGQRNDLLGQFNGEIVCETPNNLLNKFEGIFIIVYYERI